MLNILLLPETVAARRAEALLSFASPGVRTDSARYFAAEFASGEMSESLRKAAAPILKVFADDAVREVREAIAQQLKCCPFLPVSLARTLAQDVESVAMPIIRYSSVLTDEDLVAIVRAGNETKQIAVAERDTVSEVVSGALVDTENGRVVSALLANENAAIAEQALQKVMAVAGDDTGVQVLLARRAVLPLSITERLFTLVSDDIRRMIIERHDMPAELTDQIVSLARERAVARRVSENVSIPDVERLVATMQAGDRLTPTLLLRALCQGDVQFFEAAIAEKAQTTICEARCKLYESNDVEFKVFYGQTDLPKSFFRAFRTAISLFLDMKGDDPATWQSGFTQRVIDRLVEDYPEVCPESLEHVLSQISHRVLGINEQIS